jgi:hypothetical protein
MGIETMELNEKISFHSTYPPTRRETVCTCPAPTPPSTEEAGKENVMRYAFSDLFRTIEKYLVARYRLVLKDKYMEEGQMLGSEDTFGGLTFHSFRYLDIAGEELEDGSIRIHGFLKSKGIGEEVGKPL